MSFLSAFDHTALKANLGRIFDMFLHAEISPADAVADVVRLCRAEVGRAEGYGLDDYVASTLAQVERGDLKAAAALDHLVVIAAAKDPWPLLRPELA